MDASYLVLEPPGSAGLSGGEQASCDILHGVNGLV